jgi:hypothetical protein
VATTPLPHEKHEQRVTIDWPMATSPPPVSAVGQRALKLKNNRASQSQTVNSSCPLRARCGPELLAGAASIPYKKQELRVA